jgi:acetone carboxylase gamma subunit
MPTKGEKMETKRRITEYLLIDLDKEMWCCKCCGKELISARRNYKEGCLVRERDPREIYFDPIDADAPFRFCPDPDWVRMVEFYCPECGVMMETELLPPGHPITHDIELDIDRLKERQGGGKNG